MKQKGTIESSHHRRYSDFALHLKPQENPEEKKQRLYKTEICKNWEENDNCRYGRKCQYAHGKKELRSLKRHPRYKTIYCQTFETLGTCPYGIRCTFLHHSSPQQSLHGSMRFDLPANSSTPTIPKSESSCYPDVFDNDTTSPFSSLVLTDYSTWATDRFVTRSTTLVNGNMSPPSPHSPLKQQSVHSSASVLPRLSISSSSSSSSSASSFTIFSSLTQQQPGNRRLTYNRDHQQIRPVGFDDYEKQIPHWQQYDLKSHFAHRQPDQTPDTKI